MKIEIKEVEYTTPNTELPTEFIFEVSDEIGSSDELLSTEVEKLILEKTGATITGCLVETE